MQFRGICRYFGSIWGTHFRQVLTYTSIFIVGFALSVFGEKNNHVLSLLELCAHVYFKQHNVCINSEIVTHVDDQNIRAPWLGYIHWYFDKANSFIWRSFQTHVQNMISIFQIKVLKCRHALHTCVVNAQVTNKRRQVNFAWESCDGQLAASKTLSHGKVTGIIEA